MWIINHLFLLILQRKYRYYKKYFTKSRINMNRKEIKQNFLTKLQNFSQTLNEYIATEDWQWKIKWFIDVCKNIYTISSDTKIVSKILEIHLFPLIQKFADENDMNFILAEAQNWYPDISFVNKRDESIKFAVDLKTTYRLKNNSLLCNWFTLGSHWEYFRNRTSTKNIQFPYKDYLWHYCLGIIYDRLEIAIDETKLCSIDRLWEINSVISNFTFFVHEKWKIASDKSGSWNTANIWSIKNIEDIISWNWVFKELWEVWFDDYWSNHWVLIISDKKWWTKKLSSIEELLEYKNFTTFSPNKKKKLWKRK